MSLFYLSRLANINWKQELQTSKISSKALKHPFNKTLLVFTDFFTVITVIHINRITVQLHTNNGFFKLIMLLFTQ